MKEINKKYNNSYHSVLKTTPQEIINGATYQSKVKEKNNTLELSEDKNDNLSKGDDVRIYIKNDMDPFGKLTPFNKTEYSRKELINGIYHPIDYKINDI